MSKPTHRISHHHTVLLGLLVLTSWLLNVYLCCLLSVVYPLNYYLEQEYEWQAFRPDALQQAWIDEEDGIEHVFCPSTRWTLEDTR